MMDIRKAVPTNGGDWLTKFGEIWKAQTAQIQENLVAIEEVRIQEYPTDVPIIYVKGETILKVLEYLKTEPSFEYSFLADITATDEQSNRRFEVVYNLYSQARLLQNAPQSSSPGRKRYLRPLGLAWSKLGRTRDLGHVWNKIFRASGLRRILMDERWVGHPLRKDYPLRVIKSKRCRSLLIRSYWSEKL